MWSVRSSRRAFTSKVISLPTRRPKRTSAARKTITKIAVTIQLPVGEITGGDIAIPPSRGAYCCARDVKCAVETGQCITSTAHQMYLMCFALLHFLGEPRKNGQSISNDTEVGNREDGRVLILVDGYDIFRTLHACQVLNGSTDAAGDIECWFDCFARLTNLVAVRQPACINNGASRTGCST